MRGKIRNRRAAQQLRDFSGLRWGNITPTDIDLAVEFGNRIFVFAELKYKNTTLDLGQRLALERYTDNIAENGKAAICFIASHTTKSGDIDAANCIVEEYRHRGAWVDTDRGTTLFEAIDGFRKKHMQG